MMSLTVDIKDVSGKKTGTFALPAEIFDVQVNIPLIHQVVTAQLAAARQGSHKAKNRGEVAVVVRSRSSRRELVALVRVRLVHQISVTVVLLMVQCHVFTTSAHRRR